MSLVQCILLASSETAVVSCFEHAFTLRTQAFFCFPPRVFQAFGAAGLSSDYPLAQFFGWARALRFADGPDEVHQLTVAKMELKNQSRLQEPAARRV